MLKGGQDREEKEKERVGQGLFSHCSRGGDVCGKGSHGQATVRAFSGMEKVDSLLCLCMVHIQESLMSPCVIRPLIPSHISTLKISSNPNYFPIH